MKPINSTLSAPLPWGGIAHYSYALAEALARESVAVSVLMYDSPEYELADFPHQHGVVRGLSLGTSTRKRIASPLRNLLSTLRSARRSQIVHFQWSLGPRNDRLHWPLLRRMGKKLVYTAHDVLPHEPGIMALEHCRWAYGFADALVVHGERLKQQLLQNFPVDPRRVHVIPHGNYNFVADTPGPWDRNKARASFGWNDDDRVVLFFGLIRPYKGLEDLIEACRIVHERGLGAGRRLRLLIAGNPLGNHWSEGRYEELIGRSKLGQNVELCLGHVSMRDLPRFFHAADVVAVPYKKGSQSGVLQLAYSFEKAAVATRVGSLSEVIRADLARLVEPEDAPALAEALFELLVNPEDAARMGAEARRYAETDLGWSAIAQKTRALYDSLL